MIYGKVNEHGVLTTAPKKIKVDGRLVVSPRKADYFRAGYLPVKIDNTPPEGYRWANDKWEIKDGDIVRLYEPIPQEEIDYEASRVIVMMSKDEEEAFQNMETTIENAKAEAQEAVAAKEAAEAELADVSEIVEKITEVFG